MKSLEIVNKIIHECKIRIAELNHMLQNANKSNIRDIQYDIYTLEKDLKQWEQIKADLEVLEILKKYLYIVENQIPRTDDYFEILESDLDEMQDDENCDDFHKLKQWLEENENDR